MLLTETEKKLIKSKIEVDLKSMNFQKVKLENFIKNNQDIIQKYNNKIKELDNSIRELNDVLKRM
jgi:chromosome segregation ATPase